MPIRPQGGVNARNSVAVAMRVVEEDHLCVLDISQTNGAIVEATTDTQWWVRCRDREHR